MKIEYWDVEYNGAPSKLIRTEEWPDTVESFKKYYHSNISLKYCNGTHYAFSDEKDRKKYLKWVKDYDTIENYYNGGIVD